MRKPRLTCVVKKRYHTRKHASSDVMAMRKRGRKGIDTYHCNLCGGWHNGHSNKQIEEGGRKQGAPPPEDKLLEGLQRLTELLNT